MFYDYAHVMYMYAQAFAPERFDCTKNKHVARVQGDVVVALSLALVARRASAM